MNLGLEIRGRVDETESVESDSCCAIGIDKPWLDVKDEGIEESVSLVIMSEVLTVEGDLNLKHIWLGVPWN